MDDSVSLYAGLEQEDLQQPKHNYTIDRIITKRQLILDFLLRAFGPGMTFTDQMRHWVAIDIAEVLVSKNSDASPMFQRRSFKGSSNTYLDHVPFMYPTPEATDPKLPELLEPVRDSLVHLQRAPTVENAELWSWRLAGNVHRLKHGFDVLPWIADNQGTEVVLFKILEVADCQTFQGEQGFAMTMFIYVGNAAGMELTRVYRTGTEVKFANNLGIPKRQCRLIYPQEIVGMVGTAKLEPSVSKDKVPIVREMRATPSQRNMNLSIFDGRMNSAKCPYHFKPEQLRSCMDCPLRYDRRAGEKTPTCAFAVRRMNGYRQDPSNETPRGNSLVCPST